MAIKNKINTIPLAGDLCLSKNKLDVINIGDSGYIKNDGTVYGNVLSPIYQSNTNYDSEYYDRNGNRYDVGKTTLKKNGADIMTYTGKKLTVEELEYKNLLSYDYGAYTKTNDNKLIINVSGSEDDEFDFIDDNWSIASVLTCRSIYSKGALILYIGTDSKYYISWWNSEGQKASYILPWTEVNSPLITWHKQSDNLYLLSCFSDSGANFQGYTNSYVLHIDTETSPYTYSFVPLEFEPSVSQTETISSSTSYNYTDFLMNKYPTTDFGTQSSPLPNTTFLKSSQQFRLSYPYTWTNPCSISIKLFYQIYVEREDVSENLHLYKGRSFSDMASYDISDIDISQVEENLTSADVNFYMTLPQILAANNTTEMTVMVGNEMISANDKTSLSVGISDAVFDYTENTTVTEGSLHGWKRGQLPTLIFMDADNTDKKAIGFLWAEVSYSSDNTTIKERFKIFPSVYEADSDAWRSGWDYCKLYLPDEYTSTTKEYITSVTTATITDTPLVPLNALLDGGKLICTAIPQNTSDDTHFEKGLFGFTGNISTVTAGETGYTLKYTADGSNTFYLGLVEDSYHAYPYSFISRTISLDKNYFRYLLRTKGFGTDTEDKKVDETDILYDSGFNKVIINPGYNESTGTLKSGSLYQKGSFRILYNNNIVSNISYGNNDEIGTLLCDWDMIDEVLEIFEHPNQSVLSDYIVVRDVYGNILKYSYESEDNPLPYQIILDRYIVVNTTSYYNCYDMKTGSKTHYASDYNNRFLMGIECSDFLKQSDDNDAMFENNDLLQTISGSNQNGAYEITNNPISSYSVAPETLLNAWMNSNPFILKGDTAQAIDIYLGMQATVATYFTSYINGAFIRDVALDLAYMFNETVYNPNIFTKYIKTYSFNDMIINGKTNTAYPLNKYNGQFFLSYKLESGIENADNVFVVQTLVYYISGDKIWEAYFDNGTLANVSAVAAIKGLKYLGCLPTEAIFWSPIDRTFWSFGGDAILRKVIQANDISSIRGSYYNEGTQELFIATDIGLLCLNNICNYMLSDFKNVSDMFFFDNYFIVKNTTDAGLETEDTDDIKVAYEHSVLNVDSTLHLKTKWFGSTENYKSRFDCIYFRLDKPYNHTPSFKIKSNTMTDIGFESDTKTIEPTFDTLTSTAYIRYQPKYQVAVAMQFEIETNCPIISWSVGYTPLEEQAQISTINI